MTTAATPPKSQRLYDLSDGRADLFRFDPLLLTPEDGFNQRIDMGDLEVLAADIEANGLQQPLKIRKEKGSPTIYIIDGHRRHAAITLILIPRGRWPQGDKGQPRLPIPCISEAPGTLIVDRFFMQLSMNTGKPFTILEKGRVYRRILDETNENLKPADIARRTGETKQAISDALRLVNSGSPTLLDAVIAGRIADSTAIDIIKQSGTDHAAQDAALAVALEHASAAGRAKVMPKDLKPDPATREQQTSATPPAPEAPPSPSSGSSAPDPQSHSATLYRVTGAPADPLADGTWHETDRIVFDVKPFKGLTLLHLLACDTPDGLAFGYRIDQHEQLPRLQEHSSDNLAIGFDSALRAALDHLETDTAFHLYQPLAAELRSALDRYFPETGEAEEPDTLAFVAAAPAQSNDTPPDPGAMQRILDAPSSNRDGSGVSHGNDGGFIDPAKRLKQLDQILEELDGKGDESRIATANLIHNFLKNESSPASLKAHLKGDA